ncbi:hypothetical protein MTO96_013377 [Rhipicephalus appendiculatus]
MRLPTVCSTTPAKPATSAVSTTPSRRRYPPRRGYLNNLDYTVCFRKEAGYCSITYSVPGMNVPFSIQNVGADNAPTTNETEAGLGVTECTMDYLLLGGVRYCGTKLNPSTEEPNPVVNAPVTDTTSGTIHGKISEGSCWSRAALRRRFFPEISTARQTGSAPRQTGSVNGSVKRRTRKKKLLREGGSHEGCAPVDVAEETMPGCEDSASSRGSRSSDAQAQRPERAFPAMT